ncbi:uncharacterized protein K452DRAFT_25484 [Aplosporella prunicola CBS 121167]|uniref:Uncharacterized protein n=1 Tax=Aplosporella prunicola CBS 121167 TaxID=1176127 RepID=A0A6A6BD01_9PEZI|nr:uncharacterized protein K452DRAFT_25484 [Aplosporella prunicola CBS 121167]KAF2142049.1 hypothetical protein K452DRAFT_25484 [Aplosporella prunicola CBS 121167]
MAAVAALRPCRRDVISAILSDYEAMGRDGDDSPARPARGDGRAAASQATIRSTAISRSRRPPSLKLSKSNGSTATATTATSANTSTAADSTRLHHQLPLPPTPPPPPEKNAETMGNKPSKAAREDHHHHHHLRFTFRRKPVKQAPSPQPKPDSNPRLDRVASKPESKASDFHSSPAHVSTHSQAVSVPSTLTDTHDLHSTPTIAPSRDNTNTPPSETETDEPLTPKLNPAAAAIQLLPSPSPVPEESPSKYGLVNDPSMTMVGEQQKTMHARGKSSTGFDLFVKLVVERKADVHGRIASEVFTANLGQAADLHLHSDRHNRASRACRRDEEPQHLR